MKKSLLWLLMIPTLLLGACGNNNNNDVPDDDFPDIDDGGFGDGDDGGFGEEGEKIPVYFFESLNNTNYETAFYYQEFELGKTITRPATDPVNEDGAFTEFLGWSKYPIASENQMWNFDTDTLPEHTTGDMFVLYGQWGEDSYVEPEVPMDKKVTVYADDGDGISGDMYMYAWADGNIGSAKIWPGIKMTKVEGKNYWSAEVLNIYTKVIFHNENDTYKTADIEKDFFGINDTNNTYHLNAKQWGALNDGTHTEPEISDYSAVINRGTENERVLSLVKNTSPGNGVDKNPDFIGEYMSKGVSINAGDTVNFIDKDGKVLTPNCEADCLIGGVTESENTIHFENSMMCDFYFKVFTNKTSTWVSH